MTDPARLRAKLRGIYRGLQRTPLHPQWLLALRDESRSSWIAERACGDVLDVGAAEGLIRKSLCAARSYVSLDYPGTAIALYRSRPDVFGDASRLPFPDESFDTVLLLDVLEHLPDPFRALCETRRVLRTGGVLLLVVPFAYPLHDQPHDYQRLTAHGLSRDLDRAGFGSWECAEAGDAIETAASNLSIAIAQAAVEAWASRRPRAVLAVLVPLLVPVVNCAGWVLSKLMPSSGFLPGSYWIRADR